MVVGDVRMEHHRSSNAGYRFGFILSTLLGNNTRYATLRKYAGRVEDVECVWAPVRHYYLPGEKDPVRFLPGPLHTRAVVLAQAMPVLRQLARLDAVMVHQFEVSSLLALKGSRRAPVIVNAHDNPPVIDPATYPLYPEQRNKQAWRSRLRLGNDMWAARRAGYYIGFSEWSAGIMRECGLPADHAVAQHVGLDLERWKPVDPAPARDDNRTRLLFVGGDFARKGGRRLLDLYAAEFTDRCALDIVTQSDIGELPPHCRVFHGLSGGDPRLLALYRDADVLILPSEADLVPWVVLEAMAANCAVIASRIGGIPDLVSPDCGILIDPHDGATLREAIETLVDDPDRARQMGRAGRARIERDFDASVNVPRTFAIMKNWVDQRRAERIA
jgi:glycosyltransferase involved in cell wall biosynthesis